MAANDHSLIRTAVRQDEAHDYAASMAFAQDERNWFLRARGEWDEENHRPKENDMTAMEHFRDEDHEPTVSMEAFAIMTSLYYEAMERIDGLIEQRDFLARNLTELENAYSTVSALMPPKTLMELWREGQI